jgi:hypothetical protein
MNRNWLFVITTLLAACSNPSEKASGLFAFEMVESYDEQPGISATAACPPGHSVFSGGCHCFDGLLVRNWPDFAENTWGCGCRSDNPDTKTRAYAMCVKD